MSTKTIRSIHSLSTAGAATVPSPLVSTITTLLTHHPTKSKWNHLRSLLLSTPRTTASSSSTTPPLTPIHFSQIALSLKSKPHLVLQFYHFTLKNPSLCSHSLLSYSTLIHLLSRARLKSRARTVIRAAYESLPELSGQGKDSSLALFKALLKTYNQCGSAPFVFDLLVQCCCVELNRIDTAVEIVRLLRSRGISPRISTCNVLVDGVLRVKGSFAGYGVFREVFGLEGCELERNGKRGVVVRPNVHSFNALMAGFFRDGEFSMVEDLWEELGGFGCVPNMCSYSVLMAIYCEGGKRVKEAETLWEEMRVKGITPDVTAYNIMIVGFCEIGEMEKAEVLFREMELNKLNSSCLTFEHLICGYCKIGDLDSAMLLYKDMYPRGFSLGAFTLEALIVGLCGKGRVVDAMETMGVVMKDIGFRPSEKSYGFLIKGLCQVGKMDEALKFQAAMVGKGFEPNSELYDAFVDGYGRIGNMEMVEKLRNEMSEFRKSRQG